MTTETGNTAPYFALSDQDGIEHKLSDYAGKWLLLYFYPKDDTPGCTVEACAIRDTWADFKDKGVTVLGVSTDSVDSHKKFETKHSLPFPLLADEDKTVVQLYGVWGPKKMMGREFEGTSRISFLIDPNGKIAKVYKEVTPATHAGEVLRDFDELAA